MNPQFIKEIRAFNRFYTNIIGLLDSHILNSRYSLPEARILFELRQHPGLTASDIIALLGIDKGYLSRILKRFEKNKLINKAGSASDKRITILQLTAKGKKEFGLLNRSSDRQVQTIFETLTDHECKVLLQKMRGIQQILTGKK